MNKIYLSGNYVIIELASGAVYELATNVCDYKETPNPIDASPVFSIRERGLEKVQILQAALTANSWFLEDGLTNYTAATLRDFLRVSTGFSTAPGGSGAALEI